jgi:hypothetical protein
MATPILDQERADLIRGRKSNKMVTLPAWPRKAKELHLVELETTWVRFSVLNHRTKAEQLREIKNSGNPDLFSSDPLGTLAQNAQYKILRSQGGFEDLKSDLKERSQREPAIVTAEGVLINGNRRSAALRSLFADNNHMAARYVQCLVLPEDATTEELVDLETELQIARDFKEDYSWVNEALLIEELYDRCNKNFQAVASRMHREVSDIQSRYERLQQLNQLIQLSNGAYLHVDFGEKETPFEELAKHVRNKRPDEAEGVRATYFLGTLADVNYRDLRHLRRTDAAQLVRSELERDPGLRPLLKHADDLEPTQSADPLDALLGDRDTATGITSVLSLLAQKRRDETIEIPDGPELQVDELFSTIKSAITAAAIEAKAEQTDQEAVEEPLNRIRKALREIQLATAALPKAKIHNGFDQDELTSQVEELRAALTQLEEALAEG